MKPGYFRWDFHGLMSTSPLSLWVLDDSVVTWASASSFVVSTSVREGRSVSLVILHKPWGEVSIWGSWGFSLGGEGTLSLQIVGLKKDEECPKYRTVFAWPKTHTLANVSQDFVKVSQTFVLMQIQWDMKSHRLHLLNPPITGPSVHFHSESPRTYPCVVCCRKADSC